MKPAVGGGVEHCDTVLDGDLGRANTSVHVRSASSPWLAAGIAFALSCGSLLTLARRYIFSTFLIFDDTIYVGQAATGAGGSAPWRWERQVMNAVGAAFGSGVGPKVMAVVFVGATAAVLAFSLSTWSDRLVAPAVLAALVVLYPVSPQPGVFAFGTHPYFAAPFGLAAVGSLGWGVAGRTTPTRALCSCGLFFLAALMSPTAALLVIAPPLLIMLRAICRGTWLRADLLPLAISIVSLVVTLPRVLGYHYTSLVGWVSYSPESMFANVVETYRILYSPIVHTGPIAVVSYLLLSIGLGFLFLATVARRARHRKATDCHPVRSFVVRPTEAPTRVTVFLVSSYLLCAALALAPSLVVTAFTNRYVVLAWVFLGASLGSLLMRLSAASRRAERLILVSALALGLIGATVGGESLRQRTYSRQYATYTAVRDLARNEANTWPADAQVIIIFEDGTPVPTSGYNHWSTWLLRYIAERPDVSALIGTRAQLAKVPFVDKYADQGNEFWETVNGVSQRIRMKGLVGSAPTYVYLVGDGGAGYEAAPLVLYDEGSWTLVPPGDTIACAARAAAPAVKIAGSLVWTVDGTFPTQWGHHFDCDEAVSPAG